MAPMASCPPTVTDEEFLLRLLTRADEVAQARQPGQGRREALQCMRQAADVFGAMSPWRARHEEPSAFGAAEHDRQAALAQHRALLERLRQQEDTPDTTENADAQMLEHPKPDERVELVDEDDEATRFSDPVSYAKHLCDQAELTQEQRGPVALLARDMQTVYGHELARRALLTDAQRRSESLDATDVVRLPLVGRRLR